MTRIEVKMEDLRKVNSFQLYSFWKHLSIGLLTIIGLIAVSRILPFYASPIVALLAAAFLYTILYNNKLSGDGNCMIVIYAIFNCVVNYAVVVILLNILTIWDLVHLPAEFLFLNDPYIPSLLMMPICTITVLGIYLRRNHLGVCRNCKLKSNGLYERGRAGSIFKRESFFQLRNLFYIFLLLTVLIWLYYQMVYIRINTNARDWYVFVWLTVIVFIFDELYFIFRYYNLYLDLKENDEIISQEELQDMTAKTYLRFYVICGNHLYLDPHSVNPSEDYKEVLDTPFLTKRSVNGIPILEVKNIIERLTGVKGGELRFYFGRKSSDIKNRSILRYFYFLDGEPSDYKDIPVNGEWMDFDKIKKMYSRTPGRFSSLAASDISRLATIILTEKIFDEEGRRKSKIKSYKPSFNLVDVRNSQLDFQDDKWIRVSMFNADQRFFEIKRWFKKNKDQRMNRPNEWDTKL